MARELGASAPRIAVVEGDDLSGPEHRAMFQEALGARMEGLRVVSANAYIGAEPIAAALDAGAQIVVCGRVADPSLTVGPAMKTFVHLGFNEDRAGQKVFDGVFAQIAARQTNINMRDAQLLILDEPTAALDARSEFEVFKRFKELTKGKTAVLISHRFSSVRMADRIVVLMDGAVEAVGTHAELLERGGRYAELFELQAAGYR